jgi:hypothetical protein
MVSITDIGPLSKTMQLRGKDVEVTGISALILFDVLKDSDAMKKLFMERELNTENIQSLSASAPHIMGQLIASALGHHGEPDFIEAAMKNLSAGEQAEILANMIAVSFPSGLPAFMDQMTSLVGGSSGNSVLSGAAVVTKSQQASPAASETAT